MIIYLLEIIYIIYFIIFFKTRYSFHHPLELFIQKKNTIDYLKHPLYTGIYQNKICPLGHLSAILLSIWIIIRLLIFNKPYLINIIIWITLLLLGFILNINYFIYLLPIAILDIVILYKHYINN